MNSPSKAVLPIAVGILRMNCPGEVLRRSDVGMLRMNCPGDVLRRIEYDAYDEYVGYAEYDGL